MSRYAIALILALLSGCASDPQVEPAKQPDRPEAADGDPHLKGAPKQATMRINVDVEGVTMADVMKQIAKQTGKTITVDPVVGARTVTVSLRDIHWKEAVEVMARMTQAKTEPRGDGVAVVAAK